MGIEIATPNITAQTDRERLQQMQSYLYRMAQQLQWAFDSIGTAAPAGETARLSPNPPQKGKADRADPAETFANLKNLIIKSADIVNAYYDTISSRLEGLYVAQSDFGTYVQETALEIEASSKSISQLFTNEQTIVSSVTDLGADAEALAQRLEGLAQEGQQTADALDKLTAQELLTSAYIKTGLLYYREDGSPVYGLEVGQTNSLDGKPVFDKFARFASDRLSFFDSNDVEVAYISDYKLYITNAEVTGNLWLSGKFKIYYNGGLAFQWIGGDT